MGASTAVALKGGLIMSIVLCIYSFAFKSWVLAFVVAIALHNRYGYGLVNFAGPTGASFTTLWRARHIKQNWSNRPTIAKLHDVYGDIVRIGPKTLSFASPEAIDVIYVANMPKVSQFDGNKVRRSMADERAVTMVYSVGSARKRCEERERFLHSGYPLACALPEARRG